MESPALFRFRRLTCHAVLLHVHAVAQDHVRVFAGGEHQVQLGGPVGVLHRLEVHMDAGLFLQLLEKPQVVEVHVLVFQGVLEGGEADLFLGQGAAAQGQRQHGGQQQGNEFFHGKSPFLHLIHAPARGAKNPWEALSPSGSRSSRP